MKLYISPAACSLAPHIVSRELGLAIEVVRVERSTQRTGDGKDFPSINPNGYVPALVLDDGEVLLEGPAIVQYLAELKPEAGLTPTPGRDRRHIQSLLNFISTEIHKPMGQMFNPSYAPVKAALHKQVAARLDWIVTQFAGDYLTSDKLSIADAYLFVCLNWSQWLGIDLSRWPRLQAFMKLVCARPKVLEALDAENLEPHADGILFAPRPVA